MTRRRWGVVIGLLALAAACAGPAPSASAPAASNSAAASGGTQSASPTPLDIPPGVTLLRDGTLRSGVTYATLHFAIPFTVTVPTSTPDRFWFATSTSLTRAIAIGDPEAEGSGIAFYLPTGGFNGDGSPAPLPADFVTWLEHDPELSASQPRAVSVGGRPATQLDVAAIPGEISAVPGLCPAHLSCVLVASTTPEAPLQPLLIYPGIPQRVIVVDVDGGQLLIDIQPDVVVRRPAQRLLASLEFLH